MDEGSLLQLIEVLNFFSFPGNDVVSGGFNDDASVMRLVHINSGDREIGNFGVSNIFHVDTADDAPDYSTSAVERDVERVSHL